MNDYNIGHVAHMDNQQQEFTFRLNEIKAQHESICNELNALKAKIDNLLEINALQLAVCDRFIEEAGDDAEARHYLEQFKTSLLISRASFETLREEVNNL